jgi:hypothetical protein
VLPVAALSRTGPQCLPPAARLQQLPQHELEDAAVLDVLHLHRRIDARAYPERLLAPIVGDDARGE